MKTFALTSLLLILFGSFSALPLYAQGNGNAKESVSISASATVQGNIEMTTLRNMDFEDIQPSQNEITIEPVQDPQAGKMVASGVANERIRVQFIREWELTSNEGGQPITFTYNIAGNSTDDQSTAEILDTDNRDLEFNSEGEYYFWIGGNANIGEAEPGNYEGEFTIEIEYI